MSDPWLQVVNGVVASPFAVYHDLPTAFYRLVHAAYEHSPAALGTGWIGAVIDIAARVADAGLALSSTA